MFNVLRNIFLVFLVILVNYTIECDNNPWKNTNNQSPVEQQPGGDWPAIGEKRRSGKSPESTPAPQNVWVRPESPRRDYVANPQSNIWQRNDNNKAANINSADNTKVTGISIPQNSKRDYVDQNIKLINKEKSNYNGGNKSPLSNNNNPQSNNNNNAPMIPNSQNSRRDFVNTNIQVPGGNKNTGNNKAPIASNSQNSGRDYVNTNVQVPGSNIITGNNNAPVPSNSQNSRRDYVKPNIQAQGTDLNHNKGSAGSTLINNNNNQNNRRDYVNPNINNDKNAGGSNLNPKPVLSYSGAAKQNLPNQVKPVVPVAEGTTSPEPKAAEVISPEDKLKEDNELREFSEALIKKDTNNAAKYVKINYQGKTNSYSKDDAAPEPLLEISEEAYKIPSIAKLILLHNNYILESNTNEVYTAAEKIEENNFLDTIISTPVMEATRNFLVKKGKISKDPKDFKALLKTIWFNMYSRGGGRIGSSGFEHVFLAEIKKNEVSGLHNWLYFYDEEKKHNANYLGFMKKLEFDKGAIVKYHFSFHNLDKPVGGMFIGTSPEFELALYSTCFILRPDQVCPMRLGGKNFGIRTYKYRYRGKEMIGSAFPDI